MFIIENTRKIVYPKGPGTPGPPNHISYYTLGTGGLDYLGICTLSACRLRSVTPLVVREYPKTIENIREIALPLGALGSPGNLYELLFGG